MNIDFSTFVKMAGWILAGIPLLAFMFFAIHMLRGISEDDEQVKGLVSMFLAIFLIGVVILLFTYLTDFLSLGA